MSGFWKAYRGGRARAERREVATAVAPETLEPVGETLVARARRASASTRSSRRSSRRAPRWCAAQRPLDWGMGGGARARHARLGGHAGPARRPGRAARHLQPPPRGARTTRRRGTPYAPLAHLRDRPGAGRDPRQPRSPRRPRSGSSTATASSMPEALVVWEAQFGDFVNAAQVIIDQFLSSGEAKWNRLSGLVLLLPARDGGAGAGALLGAPRALPRALGRRQLAGRATSPRPRSYFHALRRQVLSPWRKPLVVMSPKSLLRHPQATSPSRELVGERFQPVIADERRSPGRDHPRRPLLGQALLRPRGGAARGRGEPRRRSSGSSSSTRSRWTRCSPRSDATVRGVELVWAQEEPENMGAWTAIQARLAPLLPGPLALVSRAPSASPGGGLGDPPQARAGAARPRGARRAGLAARARRLARRAGR